MTLAAYKEFLAQFGDMPSELLTDIVAHGKRVFHDPQHNQQWCDEHNLTTHSVGIFLGEQKRGFQATPYCYDRISKHTTSEAVVDEKGAWLFLCGRDILGKALRKGTPEHGKLVFVYDEHHNLLGYGAWTTDSRHHRIANKAVIKHITDRGVYLRRR